MRRVVLVSALCVFAAGCATSSARMGNAEMVQSLYEAFARGDAPAVLSALDSDVIWMEAENVGYDDRNPYRGPQAVGEGVFGRIMSDIPNFSVHPERFIDGGDTVVTLGRYRGTHKATGRPIDAQFAHVWTIRNGRVTNFQQYTDTAQWQRSSNP